jgi:hypothetical protein
MDTIESPGDPIAFGRTINRGNVGFPHSSYSSGIICRTEATTLAMNSLPHVARSTCNDNEQVA